MTEQTGIAAGDATAAGGVAPAGVVSRAESTTGDASPRAFEALGGETLYEGFLIDLRIERFRHADGEEVSREVVRHKGAVGIVPLDGDRVWLVRQPREAIGDPDSLEIPAGRLDHAGETPLETAQRELAEEIGRGARNWEPIASYFSAAGFSDEIVHVFLATELYESHADSGENERIELVPWPLAELDQAISTVRDAKTLIGLLWLQRRLAREAAAAGE
jgi:ADP-ribose pyrophosphatase